MTPLRPFFYIVIAGLASAVLGGGFAAAIGWLSPEFVRGLFWISILPQPEADMVRFASAAGAVAGLFLGTGAMAFCLLLATLRSQRGKS